MCGGIDEMQTVLVCVGVLMRRRQCRYMWGIDEIYYKTN